MSTYYVLTEGANDSVLGVFGYSDISYETLAEYFGGFEELSHVDVRDSGIEWTKSIACDDDECVLTLQSFQLNEI